MCLMRRLLAFAAFVLLLASMPAWAQHGGGRASGGGHSGFAARGGMAGHAGGSHAFSGMRSGPSSAHGFNRGASFHQSFHQPFHSGGFQHFHGSTFRTFGFRNCFGCRRSFLYPWAYAGSFDPYWWWDSGSSYDEDREREIAQANQMNAQSLEQQQRMREWDAQDSYGRQEQPRPQQSQQPERTETPTPATVLVFRDQHRQEVQNYAIVGQTLWNFTAQRTQKIPLAELDLAATVKANDEHGVDFHVPSSGEGQ